MKMLILIIFATTITYKPTKKINTMKNRDAKLRLIKLGYKIEGRISPRGNQLTVAIKEGLPNVYGTTLINLEKEVIKKHNLTA